MRAMIGFLVLIFLGGLPVHDLRPTLQPFDTSIECEQTCDVLAREYCFSHGAPRTEDGHYVARSYAVDSGNGMGNCSFICNGTPVEVDNYIDVHILCDGDGPYPVAGMSL